MTYFQDRTIVDENGCWIWQLGRINNGYGACKGSSAHKRSYEEHIGPVPKGKVVRHKCGNKLCCNPDHLTLGSQSDNYFDMSEEKRAELHRKAGETYSLKVDAGIIKLDREKLRKAGRASKGCKRERTPEHNQKISQAIRELNGL